jgi:glycosyltransferase involved in cell wall biosynthesis
MNVRKCTACVLHEKNITGLRHFALKVAANTLYTVGINPVKGDTRIATALGLPWLIKKKITDLELLGKICDKIVVPAKFYGEVLKKNMVSAGKIRFIPQGLVNITTSQNKKGELVSMPLKLVYLGRITKLKGLHLLLEAFHSLDPEKITLDIYGSFSENDDYESVCKKTGENLQNVSWKGVLEGKAVQHTLANYDVLCLPSFFEMSPLVIQEAFAAGVPVLASDIPGNAEQIKDGINGWLFRCNDIQDLLSKINALLQNPVLIVEARQQLPVPKLFSSVALEYGKLYREVLNNENNP